MRRVGLWLAITGVLATGALTLSGCRKYEEAASFSTAAESTEQATKAVVIEETTAPETEPETEASEDLIREEQDGKIESYLTGEPVDTAVANRRPVAVMISNDKAAWPHYGMNRAGVIYEAPTEGGINRYMAIIEDYDSLERIGSVRSCRPYYTYFAREFEAIYVHYGQSSFAVPYLKTMDDINGIEGKGGAAFYRTKDRKSPHNAYTSAALIRKAIASMNIKEAYPDGYKGHYRFANPARPELLEGGEPAAYVRPGYPVSNPWFEYNKDDGLYYRYQYGDVHKGDEGQLAVKNIIFQYCGWGYYKPTEYMVINVHTPQPGFYFTNGRAIPVTWVKEGEYGVTKYYDNGGQEIRMNPGKTWVCIITSDRIDKAEYHGEQTE